MAVGAMGKEITHRQGFLLNQFINCLAVTSAVSVEFHSPYSQVHEVFQPAPEAWQLGSKAPGIITEFVAKMGYNHKTSIILDGFGNLSHSRSGNFNIRKKSSIEVCLVEFPVVGGW